LFTRLPTGLSLDLVVAEFLKLMIRFLRCGLIGNGNATIIIAFTSEQMSIPQLSSLLVLERRCLQGSVQAHQRFERGK
jgi:hypothetical protein